MLEVRPLVVADGVVIGGNMRLLAMKDLGFREVSVIDVTEWTQAKRDEFMIKDNTHFGSWDYDALANEWDALPINEWGLDVWQPETEVNFSIEGEENNYSKNIDAPIYKVQGEKPKIINLFDDDKYKKFIGNILESSIPNDVKKFLKIAASRHIVFNYSNIAEYYAHSTKEVQDLMEESALIIIDFDKAIANGYVTLSEELLDEYQKTYEK